MDSDGSTGAARGSTADPDSPTVDVLRYETDDGPVYRAAPAGEGEPVVAAHERERRERDRLRPVVGGVLALVSVGYGVFTDSLLLGLLGGAVVVAFSVGGTDGDGRVPELVDGNVFRRDAEQNYELEDE